MANGWAARIGLGVALAWLVVGSAAAQAAVSFAPGISRLRIGGGAAGWAVAMREAPAGDDAALQALLARLDLRIEPVRDGVGVSVALAAGDHVYGLGDKAGPLDRRGRSFVFWNTDAYAWDAARDPLYKSIPFAMVLGPDGAHGLFFDTPARSVVDVGQRHASRLAFEAEGDALDVYVIAGPTPREVLQRYTALTGRTPLPPKWALGFQQSRYTYQPEARVREVAQALRDHRIPADAIYLDIGFQDANKPFTVDRAQFPRFEALIGDLRRQGLRTVLITDLHIAKQPGYAPYDSGVAADVFVKRNGVPYVGKVWPGDSVFPDFTLARVRDWWGGLYADFARMGAAGYWNDMNEPSVFDGPGGTMPDDVVHRLDDGTTRTHREIHNAYGMQNARATYDGLRKLQPDERPFVLTRAAYAGTQRYAATWTGDNTASWHHLGQATPTLLSLGLSGMALAGDDVGGFIGSPPPDLLTRWFQLGAWSPVFRNHAATDTRGHEAWVDGPAHLALRRAAIEQRYRLMPYLYTLAEENARTGAPLLRPVWFEFPGAAAFYGNGRDFLFGADLFVAPVNHERVDAHTVELPPGAWYGLRDGVRHAGGAKVVFDPAPEDVPVFVRAGAIVPMQSLVQHTGEVPRGPLEVHVFWPTDAACRGALYDDDGHSQAYRDGAYVRVAFACRVVDGGLEVTARFEHTGLAPWWREASVIVHGVPGRAPFEGARVRDARTDWRVTAVIPAEAGIHGHCTPGRRTTASLDPRLRGDDEACQPGYDSGAPGPMGQPSAIQSANNAVQPIAKTIE